MKLSELAKELGYKTPELKVLVDSRRIPLLPKDQLTAQLVALVRAKIPPASRLKGPDLEAIQKVREEAASKKQAREEAKQQKAAVKKEREQAKKEREAAKAARKVAREKKKVAKKTPPRKGAKAPEVAKKKVKAVEIKADVKLRPVESSSVTDEEEAGASDKAGRPVIELADKPEVRMMRPSEVDRFAREAERTKPKAPTSRFARPQKRPREVEPVRRTTRSRGSGFRTRHQTGAGRKLMKSTAAAPAKGKPADLKKRKLAVKAPISVKDFSGMSGIKVDLILRTLMDDGLMATPSTPLDEEQVTLVALAYNREVDVTREKTLEEKLKHDRTEKAKKSGEARAPVVVFMGHVDHGKTTLMDKIRKANVVEKEHGGITQHIGAYRVKLPKGNYITFLDTPGHEAFTKMRSRGANVTDIAVIVVAGDEGVMPQTEEAISHAKAAEVAIMVAITKCDKKGLNLHRVKQQLAKVDLNPEEYGGQTITVEVSGTTGKNVPKLLEMIQLQAEIMELNATGKGAATGTVLEANKGRRGILATVLVQEGTLKRGDTLIVGKVAGRLRAMFDENGRQVREAGPSVPVEILGLEEVPEAGESFMVVPDITQAKEILHQRELREKKRGTVRKHVTLETLLKKLEGGDTEVNLILKTDVKGTLEAIEASVTKLSKPGEVGLKVIHTAVGSVSESDVLLADASDAIIVGFNVAVDSRAKELSRDKGIDIKIYNVIYELIDHVKAAMEGMLEPEEVEEVIGRAEVKQIFKISRLGTIAGCQIREGKAERTAQARVIRDGKVLHTGKLESLKRFKDDVKEVAQGMECGIRVGGFDQIRPGDHIEFFVIKEVSRKLFQRSA